MNPTRNAAATTWSPSAISPRIPDHALARYPGAARPPEQHTGAELTRLMALLQQAGAETIAVGHGRDPASVTAARALDAAWTAGGGIVAAVIDWPATAASWLRPARRLTADHPDAWVIADTIAGCARVVRRLVEQANWTPARTVGFAGLADPDLIALTAPVSLAGMTGATAAGGTWRVGHDRVIRADEPDRTR
jgi:hypothetical protein